jgi:hypothetical protein
LRNRYYSAKRREKKRASSVASSALPRGDTDAKRCELVSSTVLPGSGVSAPSAGSSALSPPDDLSNVFLESPDEEALIDSLAAADLMMCFESPTEDREEAVNMLESEDLASFMASHSVDSQVSPFAGPCSQCNAALCTFTRVFMVLIVQLRIQHDEEVRQHCNLPTPGPAALKISHAFADHHYLPCRQYPRKEAGMWRYRRRMCRPSGSPLW